MSSAHEDAGPSAVDVCLDGRAIATLSLVEPAATALACLLRGPTWLLMVAAEIPGGVVGRLWALMSASGAPSPMELRDEDPVYAYLLSDVAVVPTARAHPDDIVAEAGHLLGNLVAGAAN